jgi:cellulose 1,4-beta-cellobiosidase
MDANWRWTHNTGGYTNCYEGTSWARNFCPDPQTCAKNCAIDGVNTSDMINTYGISSTGTSLRLNFKTGGNIGSRTYMMDD